MLKLTQQQLLLKELRKGAVNSYYATYDLRIKQAPTRIKELRGQGYEITSIQQKDRSVNWVLTHAPKINEETRSVRNGDEWIFYPDGRAVLKEEPEQLNL